MRKAVLLTLFVFGCNGGSKNTCVSGATMACSCADGSRGAQTCLDDGSFAACQCGDVPGLDGGSGGAGGADGGGAGAGSDGGGAPIAIPKTGTYTGPHNDPGISADASQCPDAAFEPNDSQSTALSAPNPVPDMTPPKIIKMAICPTGPRPDTGAHDLDFYRVDASSFPGGTITLKANVFYDVTQGDLDVGIFDSSLKMLASDGTAVSNACVAASVPSGSPGDVYYVVVAGANNMDVNRYDIQIATFSTMQTCTPASTDGGI